MTTCEMPEYRRGSAFALDVVLTNDAGAAITTDAADLAAQIYDKPDGTMLVELTVANTATVGTYLLSADLDAEDVDEWPSTVFTNIFNTATGIDSTTIAIKITGQLSREIAP